MIMTMFAKLVSLPGLIVSLYYEEFVLSSCELVLVMAPVVRRRGMR